MLKNLTLALVLIAGVAGAAWAQSASCITTCSNVGGQQSCLTICN